jgi:hypothetical protein
MGSSRSIQDVLVAIRSHSIFSSTLGDFSVRVVLRGVGKLSSSEKMIDGSRSSLSGIMIGLERF